MTTELQISLDDSETTSHNMAVGGKTQKWAELTALFPQCSSAYLSCFDAPRLPSVWQEEAD